MPKPLTITSVTKRILAYIKKNPKVSYEVIQATARKNGVEDHILIQAFKAIHRRKDIMVKQKDDTLYYKYRVPPPPKVKEIPKARERTSPLDDFICIKGDNIWICDGMNEIFDNWVDNCSLTPEERKEQREKKAYKDINDNY